MLNYDRRKVSRLETRRRERDGRGSQEMALEFAESGVRRKYGGISLTSVRRDERITKRNTATVK